MASGFNPIREGFFLLGYLDLNLASSLKPLSILNASEQIGQLPYFFDDDTYQSHTITYHATDFILALINRLNLAYKDHFDTLKAWGFGADLSIFNPNLYGGFHATTPLEIFQAMQDYLDNLPLLVMPMSALARTTDPDLQLALKAKAIEIGVQHFPLDNYYNRKNTPDANWGAGFLDIYTGPEVFWPPPWDGFPTVTDTSLRKLLGEIPSGDGVIRKYYNPVGYLYINGFLKAVQDTYLHDGSRWDAGNALKANHVRDTNFFPTEVIAQLDRKQNERWAPISDYIQAKKRKAFSDAFEPLRQAALTMDKIYNDGMQPFKDIVKFEVGVMTVVGAAAIVAFTAGAGGALIASAVSETGITGATATAATTAIQGSIVSAVTGKGVNAGSALSVVAGGAAQDIGSSLSNNSGGDNKMAFDFFGTSVGIDTGALPAAANQVSGSATSLATALFGPDVTSALTQAGQVGASVITLTPPPSDLGQKPPFIPLPVTGVSSKKIVGGSGLLILAAVAYFAFFHKG